MRVITLIALCLTLSSPIANAQIQPEQISLETMAEPGENWFMTKTRAGAFIWDGNTGEMQGLISLAGFLTAAVQPNFSRKEFYAAEQYYSRGVHGDRSEILTIYDFENLSPIAEVDIPNKTAVLSFRGHIGLTASKKFLGVFNMTPAQSISIVDVENRTFVEEISVPGCAMILPVSENDFMNICGDGTLQVIQLDDNGNESNRIRSEKFFDIDEDPVFDHPVATKNGWFLVSHGGKAFDVSKEGNQINISQPWSIVSEEDIEEEWLPGGAQFKTVHKELGLAYILMHQGGEYTHHDAGTEIWVFDTSTKRRIARIEMEVPAEAVMVTQESAPLLVVSDEEGGLHIYNAITMKHERTIEDSGPAASLLEDL